MKWSGCLVLLLPAFGWWCETSDRHGCRGKSRHFVREAAVANPFLVFEDITTGMFEETTVVDWDGDGDLDVVLRKQDGLSLFEFKSGMHFAEVIPNPFHGISGGVCRPEVLDWDGDGRLDLIVGAKDGIRYYQKQKGPYLSYELHQRLGAENPFDRIRQAVKGGCSDISIGDWDGDGDLDVILSSFGSPMRYFEQSQGQLVLRGGLNRSDDSSPFYEIENQTVTHRPIMVDWNGDGNMDILLVAKYRDVFLSNASVAQTLCTSYLYEQHKIDGKTTLVFKDEPFFRNEGCSSFDGFGVSFVDVDKDGDLDAIFGSTNAPLRVYKRTSAGLVKPSEFPSNSTPLDMIQLGSKIEHSVVPYPQSHLLRPVLADWDLDGDLDLALINPRNYKRHPEKNRYFLHLPDDTVTELNGPPNSSCPIDWGLPFSMADFDGDGKNDLLGFSSYRVVVCLQSSSGFIVVEPDEIPFKYIPNCPQCLTDVDLYWTAGIFGFPSFLDWDGDGDLDVLRTNLGDQVFLYEQLSNGTVFAHPLPLPLARDFSAADFDGDGDVDIMIIPLSSNGCLYFERLGDGSLEQMFGTDNPFNGACEENSNGAVTSGIYASLADWDGDGEKDLIVVDDFKVTLWTNRPMQSFVEVMEKDSPFGKFAFPEPQEVTLVDVNHDFRLDLVIPPHSTITPPAAVLGYETFRFFEQGASGLLVERQGEANPFDKLAFNKTIIKYLQLLMKTQVVDLDGDGDLDIVRAFRYHLHYARNDGGHFTHLNPSDPENPFREVQDNLFSCWTFVDWDEDGDMDLLQAYQPGGNTTTELAAYAKRAGEIIREMLHNGTSRDERVAWTQKNLYRQMRFYRNVGGSFQELTGSANPFRDLASSMDIDKVPSCPAFVDLDKDDVLELVLSTTNGQLQYFKQLNGTFQRVEETPFADLSSKVIWNQAATNNNNIIPRFVDWDGDGDMDLVITGLHKVHFFQRGVCTPSASYCKSGLCNQRTSTCTCDAGAEGQDCSLCGNFYVREKDQCRPCPGHNELAGTCSRRGICEDDADARNKRRAKNLTGFEMISARGTGQCTCSRPFSGLGCREGQCPVGERLDRHAKVETATEKYPQWEACVPCESGKFKNFSGNEECRRCPGGHVPLNRTSCVPCGSGTIPSRDHPENCTDCPEGFVAAAGTTRCVACKAGTAPNEGRSACVACEAGTFARPRSKQCEICPLGEVPNKQNNGCDKCTGQTYAFEGDESCRTCFFPALILTGDENLCTPVYTGLFLFASILLAVFVLAILGRLRVECLKRRLKKLVAARNWKDLHTTQAKPLEYGLWQRKADKLIEHRKDEVKSRSLQLGVSLDYVFGQLEDIYMEKAQQAEWRVDVWGPTKRSGFFVRVRNSGDAVDPESAWPTLSICDHPEDPNFHQVAALLAYGPWALGKGLCCPRDGLADCSLVDALETECNSAKATWFLSWVWNYQFTTVLKALARWWQRHRMVLGAADDGKGIYIWWCLFVNNQFRLLEEGQTQDTNDFFHVFGQQVEGIGKMLMCLDQMRGSQYTSRIWCIFEVFVACQRSIPTTVILPELEVGAIETLEDLTKQCRVDAEKAKASVQADADAIKERIQKEHQSFEYVNKTVEQALWCEVIKFLEQSQQPEEIEQSTETPQEPDLSSSSVPASAMVSANSQCSLQ